MSSKVAGKPVGKAGSMSELLAHNCEPDHKHMVKTTAKEDHMFGIFQHTVDKNMNVGKDTILPLPGTYFFLFLKYHWNKADFCNQEIVYPPLPVIFRVRFLKK